MLPHPLTNFEIQKYYQNEPRFIGIYSRDNLPDKVKDGTCVINLEEFSDIGTHWVALYALSNNVTNKKEIKIFIDKSTVVTNIFRIQAYDLVMCGYFCIGFFDFMFSGKTLTDFTSLLSPIII